MIQDIGVHRVQCADVMKGIDKLMGSDIADICYFDPPWGQGNLSYWQTINKRHNGIEKEKIDYNQFLNQIFALASRYTYGVVFIEYGIQWEKDIISIGEQHGLKHLAVIQIKYKSGSKWLPHHLHVFTNSNLSISPSYAESLVGTTGLPCLLGATAPFIKKDGIILDPCCGLGMTAELAKATGMRFRGNELNKTRLKTTIKKLQ